MTLVVPLRRWFESLTGRDARDVLAVAVDALTRRKLRTALSVVGIVLGVGAVVAMMSINEGARQDALLLVEQLGVDNIVIRYRGAAPGSRSAGLTVGDLTKIERLVPLVRSATPVVERYVTATGRDATHMTRVLGVGSAYADVVRLQVGRGRFLGQRDEDQASRVCILGAALHRRLFGHRDGVGGAVRLGDTWFRVVGVLAGRHTDARGIGAIAARDLNEAAIVPITALAGQPAGADRWRRVDEIWVKVADGNRVLEISPIVARTLARSRRGGVDYEIVVPRELLEQRYRTQRTFAILVGSVALISLVVGGIGITNIMLASVLERTAEIGLRRTVGARRRDIAVQFLLESLLMTTAGGVAGVLLGAGASWIITSYAGWATSVSSMAILLSLFVAFTTGLVFGSYPAIRAARLQPIDAVRYE